MRWTLAKSLWGEWAQTFAVAVFGILAVLLVMQLARLAPLVFRSGYDAWVLLSLMGAVVPGFLAVVLPVGHLAALWAVLARWRRDGEWIGLRAVGVSFNRVAWLTAPLSLGVALGVAGFVHLVAPANLALGEALIKEAAPEALARMIQPGRLVRLGDAKIYVAEITPDGAWRHPLIVREDGGETDVIRAESARCVPQRFGFRLEMENGVWERRGDKLRDRLAFRTVSVPLSVHGAGDGLAGVLVPWQGWSSIELMARLQNPDDGNPERRRWRATLALRLAAPLAALGFGLLAVGLGLRWTPSSSAGVYAASAACVTVYYLLERLGMALGEKGTLTPEWAPLPPLALLFLVVALLLWPGRRRE